MQVLVSGQHISIGTSLQEYVNQKINEVSHKYFENPIKANVHFSKQGHELICDVVVNEGTGRNMLIKASGHEDEIYTSFDIALTKLEKQLRRYKSRLKNHHKTKPSEITEEAIKYVISPSTADEASDIDNDNPVIVAEKPTEISQLSVGRAVMKMDLENLPALMFKNAKTGRINVVYYRKDGNISWVDSK